MKENKTEPQVRRAAIGILTYLRDHPTAKDTMDGIAKWWVGEEESIVDEALALIIAEGVMEQRGESYQLAKSPNRKKMIEHALWKIDKRKKGQ